MDFNDFQQSKTGDSTWVKRNPIATGAIGLMALFALANSPSIARNMQAMGRVREQSMASGEVVSQLQANQIHIEEQAKIADSRYQSGCVIVVASNDPNSFTSLTAGQPVLDGVRDAPLPPGTLVCDAFGNTARINDQSVADAFAFTGNKEVIQEAIERNQVEAQFTAPEVE